MPTYSNINGFSTLNLNICCRLTTSSRIGNPISIFLMIHNIQNNPRYHQFQRGLPYSNSHSIAILKIFINLIPAPTLQTKDQFNSVINSPATCPPKHPRGKQQQPTWHPVHQNHPKKNPPNPSSPISSQSTKPTPTPISPLHKTMILFTFFS
jgi:hypothetical protein